MNSVKQALLAPNERDARAGAWCRINALILLDAAATSMDTLQETPVP